MDCSVSRRRSKKEEERGTRRRSMFQRFFGRDEHINKLSKREGC